MKKNISYLENNNIYGVDYLIDNSGKIISEFEKLNYNEKLDIISEIIIRYDNETYFNEKITVLNFGSNLNGFDIAKNIQNIKGK